MRTGITRTFSFDAAHLLPWHPGKCQRLHGHTYRLEVSVEGPVGDRGIVCDFAELDALVHREVIDRYDHRYLNDLLDNPTAENIATEIWKFVEAGAPAGIRLAHVRLWETLDSAVDVWP